VPLTARELEALLRALVSDIGIAGDPDADSLGIAGQVTALRARRRRIVAARRDLVRLRARLLVQATRRDVREDGVQVTPLAASAPLHDQQRRVPAERQPAVLPATIADDLKDSLTALVWLAEALQRRTTAPDDSHLLDQFVRGARQLMLRIDEHVDTTLGQLGRSLALERRRVILVELVGRLAAKQPRLPADQSALPRSIPAGYL
jgi:hypothetical protein